MCGGGVGFYSDHRLVRWSVYVGSERREEIREVLDYRQADYEGMRRELSGVDWVSLLSGDIEQDWVCFRNFMRDLERMYVPVRRRGGGI